MLDGTDARAGSALVSSISSPPAGAGFVRVIVPVAALLPTSDVGVIASEASVTAGGWSVTTDERVMPLRVAETTAGIAGVTSKLTRSGGRIVRVPLWEVPRYVVVTTAFVAVSTADAVAMKSALVDPAGTITVDGTLDSGALLDSAIIAPP